MENTEVGRLVTDAPLIALRSREVITLLWGLRKLWNARCQKLIKKHKPCTPVSDVLTALESTEQWVKNRPRRGSRTEWKAGQVVQGQAGHIKQSQSDVGGTDEAQAAKVGKHRIGSGGPDLAAGQEEGRQEEENRSQKR